MITISANFMTLGRAAMLLAMSQTREQEEEIKQLIKSCGMQCCVTEAGGVESDFKSQSIRNILGAAYANKIIEKNSIATHALLHAAVEAGRNLFYNMPVITSLKMKFSVVKNDEWICVAAFGDCGMHTLTSHDRSGMGMMHLGTLPKTNKIEK